MVAVLRPLIFLWASLNVMDDLTIVFRAMRLGTVLVPGLHRNTDLCQVCDDVMGDLLKGTDGLEALPCNWACLRVPKCVRMCERVKAVSINSTHYPCIAAGYCDAVAEGEIDAVAECSVGPFFTCSPKRYCVRKRHGVRFSCDLRPGIGRWIGMRNAVSTHAAALAEGLFSQPHCGEVGAGPYCIATPRGLGAACEVLGNVLSVVWGGWKTIVSIESPGGDDDRQWLTFWLILTLLLFVERYLARVVLSTVPIYYHAKLLILAWLLFRDGADDVYRHLRRLVASTVGGRMLKNRQRKAAKEEMDSLRAKCKDVVDAALREEEERKSKRTLRRMNTLSTRKHLVDAVMNSTAATGGPAESTSTAQPRRIARGRSASAVLASVKPPAGQGHASESSERVATSAALEAPLCLGGSAPTSELASGADFEEEVSSL